MEGVFAFFLESTFLGLFLFGEKRLGPRRHLAAAVALALGSWLSGYFIIVANAFMQHPVGYRLGEDGVLHLESFSGVPLQSLGALAVRPQHDGLGRHGVVRRGRRGGLLVADGPARPPRGDLPARGGDRRAGLQPAGRVPDRGRPREDGGEAPAGDPRRDGGAVRGRTVRRAGHHRAARTSPPASWRTRSSCPGS